MMRALLNIQKGPWGPSDSGKGRGGGSKRPPSSKPPYGGDGNNGSGLPDFEKALQEGRDQLKVLFGGGGRGKGPFGSSGRGSGRAGGRKLFFIVATLLFCGWLATGIYKVGEKEQGAVLRFGSWVETVKEPGLHYHFPTPIEEVLIAEVSQKRSFSIGIDTASFGGRRLSREKNVFMLTGDENILDGNMTVHWYIKDLGKFLFRAIDPEEAIKIAAESVLREVIALTTMELALTTGKEKIADQVFKNLQTTLDDYELGIAVDRVSLEKMEAPAPVIAAFRDVQSARADQERMINEARGYRDSIIPVARGEAEKIIQQATGYRDAVTSRAEGEASRFESMYAQYKLAPDVTRQRMYIEAMENIFSQVKKVLIASKSSAAQGVLPYLPLPALRNTQEEKSEQRENG